MTDLLIIVSFYNRYANFAFCVLRIAIYAV